MYFNNHSFVGIIPCKKCGDKICPTMENKCFIKSNTFMPSCGGKAWVLENSKLSISYILFHRNTNSYFICDKYSWNGSGAFRFSSATILCYDDIYALWNRAKVKWPELTKLEI